VALEQEVKLAFPNAEAARRAVVAAGGRLVVSRRLVEDEFFDTGDSWLVSGGTTLRLRRDGSAARLTWKGPLAAAAVKTREELETDVGDAATLRRILQALRYEPTFRSEKFREEYALDEATVTVDETPAGSFVEIEGTPDSIARVAGRLGRSPADYVVDSYITLWRRQCMSRGVAITDMLFDGARR
jgi:adenylate cyclase class 2